MKDWISFCLYQLSDLIYNKDGESRVDALIALSKLHDITAPRAVHVTMHLLRLEQIEAEIARRQAQRLGASANPCHTTPSKHRA